MVEQQPSKLNTRVRFPSPAPRLSMPARRHGSRNVPKTWVTALCPTGCREVAGFSAPGRVSQIRMHEADEPNALAQRELLADALGGVARVSNTGTSKLKAKASAPRKKRRAA